MFGIRRKKRAIERLRRACAAERNLLDHDIRMLAPTARKAAGAGAAAVLLKKAAPVLRPVAFGLIQRGLAKRNRGRLVKLAGVASVIAAFVLHQT